MTTFDREVYFDTVRGALFGGHLTQQQIDGQNAILTHWEDGENPAADLRHLAYMLATTKHETASTMWPIAEHGKGEGQPYGVPDPETKQTYYGRGFVQLTWRENYQRATDELELKDEYDLVWHADAALYPGVATDVMFIGMTDGWFRKNDAGQPERLQTYFNETIDDAFEAREIINGDKNTVPDWSNGVSIGNLIMGYHASFLYALQLATLAEPQPPAPVPSDVVTLDIAVPDGIRVALLVNGELVFNQ